MSAEFYDATDAETNFTWDQLCHGRHMIPQLGHHQGLGSGSEICY